MKNRFLLPILSAAALLSFSPAVLNAAGDEAAKEASGEMPAKKTRKALEKGMPAEEVIAQIGKPQTVTRMKSEEGNAETWTYRRVLNQEVFQAETMSISMPAFSGVSGDGSPMMGGASIPEYRLKHRTTYQVTSLLMFEGKLVLAKQWREVDESFAN